jgi:hypothetical protein
VSEKLLAQLLLDRDVKQEVTCSCVSRKRARISIDKLLAPVFGEMLFDWKSGKKPVSINELLAPLENGIETDPFALPEWEERDGRKREKPENGIETVVFISVLRSWLKVRRGKSPKTGLKQAGMLDTPEKQANGRKREKPENGIETCDLPRGGRSKSVGRGKSPKTGLKLQLLAISLLQIKRRKREKPENGIETHTISKLTRTNFVVGRGKSPKTGLKLLS